MQLIYKYIAQQFGKPTGCGGKISTKSELKVERIVEIESRKSICVIARNVK
jgi:hypothetical protein